MAVCNYRIFSDESKGSSILEVILSMAVVALATPILYSQISETNNELRDMATANKIVELRDSVLNFIRLNQASWPDIAQIRLADEELDNISEFPVAGFIDKYAVNGATITDVYLAFDLDNSLLRTSQVAKHIGSDAAVVGSDGIAYGDLWAVAAPDFKPGNLIYKISRDINGEDKTKYLHRTKMGEDDLNVMLRDLNLGKNKVYDVGGVVAKSAEVQNISSSFIETGSILSNVIYFSSGANLDADQVAFGSMRISDDVSGFRNIYADKLNGDKYTTNGRIITDRATVLNSVKVANNLVLKSDSIRTISGFTGVTAHSLTTSYISAEEITFYDNFGLTVSGELLMSTTVPIRLGGWSFPSLTPPRFAELNLSRASVPAAPINEEFSVIMSKGWQAAQPKEIENAF